MRNQGPYRRLMSPSKARQRELEAAEWDKWGGSCAPEQVPETPETPETLDEMRVRISGLESELKELRAILRAADGESAVNAAIRLQADLADLAAMLRGAK